MSKEQSVTVTPTVGGHDVGLRICGLKEGARVTISVPGANQECHYFVGKHRHVHTFGFDEPGSVKLGQCDHCTASEADV